jgi:hypothetical protein
MNTDPKSASAMARAPADVAEGQRAKRKPPMSSAARSRVLQTFSQLDDNVLLTELEVAEVVNVTGQTLKKWRLKAPGKGPAPVYMHGCVRYRVAVIRAWLDAFSSNAA